MAIKKRFTGGNPIFCFLFVYAFCSLVLARDFFYIIFVLFLEHGSILLFFSLEFVIKCQFLSIEVVLKLYTHEYVLKSA